VGGGPPPPPTPPTPPEKGSADTGARTRAALRWKVLHRRGKMGYDGNKNTPGAFHSDPLKSAISFTPRSGDPETT